MFKQCAQQLVQSMMGMKSLTLLKWDKKCPNPKYSNAHWQSGKAFLDNVKHNCLSLGTVTMSRDTAALIS